MSGDYFYTVEQPFHVLPAHSQVSAVNLSHFPTLVEQLGGNCEDILERHGISLQVLREDNHFIDCKPFVDMFEYCANTLNDPVFGLHLAELQDSDIYGCVAALCKSAGTIRQGINGLIDFLPVLHSSESVLELVEGESTSELRWTEHSDFGENDQANGQGLLLNLKLLRAMLGKDFVPSYVNVSDRLYRRAGDALDHLLACPVRASRERSCIAFPTEVLKQDSLSANRPLHQLINGYLTRLKSSQAPSLQDKVNDFISAGINDGRLSIETCAKHLGVSTRVLQLRLKSMNLSYSDMLENHRMERAKTRLLHSDLSIPEIADQLGYAERTSFGRAFKRWTGVSPQQFRQIR